MVDETQTEDHGEAHQARSVGDLPSEIWKYCDRKTSPRISADRPDAGDVVSVKVRL